MKFFGFTPFRNCINEVCLDIINKSGGNSLVEVHLNWEVEVVDSNFGTIVIIYFSLLELSLLIFKKKIFRTIIFMLKRKPN